MPFPSHNFNSLNAWVAAKTKNGFLKYKRPVEVGTNIEVEALLVSSRRRLLAEIRHCLCISLFVAFLQNTLLAQYASSVGFALVAGLRVSESLVS